MFGLNRDGFKRKKYSDVVESLRARSVDIFGESINLNDNSFLGMLINVVAWAISLIWELAEKVYFNKFVDYADGNNLDLATRNNGITRRAAEKAKGVATFDGVVPVGFLVKINGTLFETIESGTVVKIRALEGGIDGNIPTGATYEIVTPISNVNSFTSTETTAGRNVEADAELRTRFFASLASAGASTLDSIISALLRTEGVKAATVEEIEEGGYYKGIRPIVLGGSVDNIAQTIFNYKAFGIKTIGVSNGTALADNGDSFTINFDYATSKNIAISITVTTDNSYDLNGDQLVKDEINNYINSLSMGDDVIYSKVIISAFKVVGVIDVDVTLDGGKSNVVVAFDEVATADVVIL